MTVLVVGAFSVLIVLSLYYQWTKLNFWKNRGVKTLKPNFLFGNATDLIFRKTPLYNIFGESYRRIAKSGERYFGFYFSSKASLVVTDPELIKHVLAKNFNHFMDRPFYSNKEVDPFSDNLAGLNGKKWKHMRDKLAPAFTSSNMKLVFEAFSVVGNQLQSMLHQSAKINECVNLSKIIRRYNIDVLSACIFGIDCNTLEGQNLDFEHYVEKIIGRSFKRYLKVFLALVLPSILNFFRIPFTDEDIQKFYTNVTSRTINYREQNNVVKKDLMHLLIQLRNNINIENDETDKLMKNDINKSLSVEEVASQATIFTAAGFESSTTIILGFIYEVLLNKDVEDKLREEINTVLKAYDGKITYESLWEMPYLEMCLSETIRKYTTVPFMIRECTKDIVLPGTNLQIEKKQMILIPAYEVHHDPEFYPNPDKFDPERFTTENRLKRHDFTFLGFSKGPRNCIGKRFGIVQVKLAILTIFKNYFLNISPKSKTPLELNESSFMLQFKTDLIVNLKKVKGYNY